MKIQFTLLVGCLLLFMSCNTTKKTPPVKDVEDQPIMEDHDEDGTAGIITITEFQIYEVTTDENGEEVFNEKRVLGDGSQSVNADNVPTLRIIESGTGRVINCIERAHPRTGLNVFVDIGGTTDERER